MPQKSNIKVLSLGLSQSNFIIQLYKGILDENKHFEFYINDFYDLSSNTVKNDVTIFREMYYFSKQKVSKLLLIQYFIKSLFKKDFWGIFFFEKYTLKKSYKSVLKTIYRYVREYAIITKHLKNNYYNIFHFHYCVPEMLTLLKFLPKKANIVCSFWGSDLLRTFGQENSYYVNKALSRATLITTQSKELKKIIVSKYDEQLESKIRCLKFTLNKSIFDNIKNQSTAQSKNNFKEKYKIDLNKKIITVGYNAKKENNHLEIINKIDLLGVEFKDKIAVVIPLAYGMNKDYIKLLKGTAQKFKSLQIIFIDEFLPPKETAQLRVNTDIQIQMPMSDALSGSVLEVMYANNIALCGSWLPYSPFEDAKIRFFKIDNFEQLPQKLTEILTNFNELKKTLAKNKVGVEDYFFPKQTSKAWVNLYKELKYE